MKGLAEHCIGEVMSIVMVRDETGVEGALLTFANYADVAKARGHVYVLQDLGFQPCLIQRGMVKKAFGWKSKLNPTC